MRTGPSLVLHARMAMQPLSRRPVRGSDLAACPGLERGDRTDASVSASALRSPQESLPHRRPVALVRTRSSMTGGLWPTHATRDAAPMGASRVSPELECGSSEGRELSVRRPSRCWFKKTDPRARSARVRWCSSRQEAVRGNHQLPPPPPPWPRPPPPPPPRGWRSCASLTLMLRPSSIAPSSA